MFVEYKDNYGETLLMIATSNPVPPQIIGTLLAKGADLFTKCAYGKTPFSEAIKRENIKLIESYINAKMGLIHFEELKEISRELKLVDNNKIDFYKELMKDSQGMDFIKAGLDLIDKQTCLEHIKSNLECLGEYEDDSEEGSDYELMC